MGNDIKIKYDFKVENDLNSLEMDTAREKRKWKTKNDSLEDKWYRA